MLGTWYSCNMISSAYADRSEGDFRDIFKQNLRFLRFFFGIIPPTGNPNRLKMMPRCVGSISTPADVLSAFFEISCLFFFFLSFLFVRCRFVISSKQPLFEKSKLLVDLEIYCVTRKSHTHQDVRNGQVFRQSFI